MLTKVATEDQLAALRLVLFAGEVCPDQTLRTMFRLAPTARYANLFGPTETNVCTYHEVERADLDRGSLPIGRAITGVTTWVMSSPHRQARPGQRGELYVCGPTVAAGYWDAPDHTAERFVPIAHGVAYRTGDVVTRDNDGVLRFHGRIDRQVKIRGHRVELDEVELVLREHPMVDDAAVFKEETIGQLVAVVATSTATTAAELRRACAARLPEYAVPHRVHIRTALPRTTTGKLDRRALAEP